MRKYNSSSKRGRRHGLHWKASPLLQWKRIAFLMFPPGNASLMHTERVGYCVNVWRPRQLFFWYSLYCGKGQLHRRRFHRVLASYQEPSSPYKVISGPRDNHVLNLIRTIHCHWFFISTIIFRLFLNGPFTLLIMYFYTRAVFLPKKNVYLSI